MKPPTFILYLSFKIYIDTIILIQLFLILVIINFIFVPNLYSLWVNFLEFLFFIGLLLLSNDSNILIGFLWIIDFGLSIIILTLLISLMRLYSQLYRISYMKYITLVPICFGINFYNTGIIFLDNSEIESIWYDFYEIWYIFNISDLELMRYLYFYLNSYEFIIINLIILITIFNILGSFFSIKLKFVNLYQFIKTYKNLFFSNKIIKNQKWDFQLNKSNKSKMWKKF